MEASVVGKVLGNLSVSLRKVTLKDGTSPVNYTVRWEWWGQRGSIVSLSAPWKSGSLENEAVFPLRAKQGMKEYLADMKEMKLELLNDKKQRVAKAAFPLRKIVDNDRVEETVTLMGLGKSSSSRRLRLSLPFSLPFRVQVKRC